MIARWSVPRVATLAGCASTVGFLAFALAPMGMLYSRGRFLNLALVVAVIAFATARLLVKRLRSTLVDRLPALHAAEAKVGLALVLYAALSLCWTPAPLAGAESLATLVSVVASIVVLYALIEPSERRPCFVMLIVGIAVAATAAIIDLLRAGPGRSAEMPMAGYFGGIPYPWLFNQALTTFCMVVWLGVGFAWVNAGRGIALALLFLVSVAIALSVSQSAQLGLAVGTVVAILGHTKAATGRLVAKSVIGACLAALLLAPAFGTIVTRLLPDSVAGFAHSAAARLGIWRAFGGAALAALPGGWGYYSSRFLAQLPRAVQAAAPDAGWLRSPHPHNMPLQIWVELGVPGIMAALVLLALLGRRLVECPAEIRPWLAAAVGATATVGCVSHNASLAWWFGALGLVVLLSAIWLDDRRFRIEHPMR